MPSSPLSPLRESLQGLASVRRRLALIVLIALVLRLAVTALPSLENLIDADHIHSWEQGNVARALVAGHGFGSPLVSDQPSAIMPPVYPLCVAFFFKILGVHTAQSIFAVHVFDSLINALTCIPLFLLARRGFGDRMGWIAAWSWAFFPYGIYFSASWAWSTHLLLFCLCWLLYLAQSLELSPRLGLWAGFGLLMGFAGLTEPSVLMTAPFLLGLACWRLRQSGLRWFLPGLTASLVIAATLSPWIVRNALVFHKFIPMRDSMGLELWMGNNGQSLRWTSDNLHPLHDSRELAAYNRMGELAYMAQKSDEAHRYIAAHPGWYADMCLRRAIYLWTGYWSFDRAYLAEEPMDLPNIPFATALTGFAIAGLVLLWKHSPYEAIRFAGVMMLMPAIYYFSHPEPYHMRSLDPIMVMLSGFAILCWRERARAVEALPAKVALEV
jgi:4-amino-4-deoxy-L-arabinose transferase-like glycosyltransferase